MQEVMGWHSNPGLCHLQGGGLPLSKAPSPVLASLCQHPGGAGLLHRRSLLFLLSYCRYPVLSPYKIPPARDPSVQKIASPTLPSSNHPCIARPPSESLERVSQGRRGQEGVGEWNSEVKLATRSPWFSHCPRSFHSIEIPPLRTSL